ncbi:hypothetical protein ACTXMW_16075 [Brachybacterium paraconglomeratum]
MHIAIVPSSGSAAARPFEVEGDPAMAFVGVAGVVLGVPHAEQPVERVAYRRVLWCLRDEQGEPLGALQSLEGQAAVVGVGGHALGAVPYPEEASVRLL